MSIFSDAEARVASQFRRVFGDPITYREVSGEEFTITAARSPRSPDEISQNGAFEALIVWQSEFLSGPTIGAVVRLGDDQYVISDIRDPDPNDGMKILILNRHFPLPPQ